MDSSSVKRYYEIEQNKLLLDFEKVSLFTSHPTSLGTFREQRLRQYLRDFTPTQLSLSSGFITAGNEVSETAMNLSSRQVDCLVFDEHQRHADFRTEDYVIIGPEQLFAAIEIKSSLTFYQESAGDSTDDEKYPHGYPGSKYRWAGTLIDALINIKSVADVLPKNTKNIFLGIFGYSSTFEIKNLYSAFDSRQIQRQLGIQHISELPVAICVPSKYIVHFSAHSFEDPEEHEFCTTYFTSIETAPDSMGFPLQFFTTYYLNLIGYKLNGTKVSRRGLNSHGATKIWYFSHHFDLASG